MEGIKIKQFAEGEFPIEGDTLGVLLRDKSLFHGSANPNTERFMTSEEAETANLTDGATVGLGLYLTSSEKAATAYARRRAFNLSKKEGVVATSYLTKLENLKLLDLRTQENITKFTEKFRDHLVEILRNKSKPLHWLLQGAMIEALKQIGKGITLQNIHSLTGYGMAGVFTDFAKQHGYDGAVTLEGGEGYADNEETYTGEHDSYVIFDPTKAAIISKQKL